MLEKEPRDHGCARMSRSSERMALRRTGGRTGSMWYSPIPVSHFCCCFSRADPTIMCYRIRPLRPSGDRRRMRRCGGRPKPDAWSSSELD